MIHESFMAKIVSDNMNAAIREIVKQEIQKSLSGTVQEIATAIIQEEVPLAIEDAFTDVTVDGGDIE